ncbi:hypothetical protein [Emticicia sp. BO119]|uniref:hypothetical protein n=1 Tax=Emticicia sp. BO119 TaxID=2757768 RepID=UPI0015F03792|nr:hypothetical protein [Emticicia sp. BO119]MBA4852153.1 hypothetical protein [Emticicia sp. BO119]
MNRIRLIVTIIINFCVGFGLAAQKQPDYLKYHQDIIKAEKLIINGKYTEALVAFEKVFDSYEYIFLRDYKVAAQLAFLIQDETKAFDLMRRGISVGWTLKNIRKNEFLRPLQKMKGWEMIKSEYGSLRSRYKNRINLKLRAEVHEMLKRDQWLDLPYYLRIGQKAKERYAIKKFKPNNEKQIKRLNEILEEYGYPGEKLIGNTLWMSTILVHHNSISSEYARRDTLYPTLKPRLLAAIQRGEMAPDDYAIIEDWYVVVKSNRQQAAYGYLNTLTEQELPKVNELRKNIGLRSIEIRNSLVDIQSQTGMNFYLDGKPWVNGKIIIVNKR